VAGAAGIRRCWDQWEGNSSLRWMFWRFVIQSINF
jgi:hypothetical protein